MESENEYNDTEKLGFSKFRVLSNHDKPIHFEVLEANSQFKNICGIQKARNKEEENQIINLWLNKKNKKLVVLFSETILEQGKINKLRYHNEENNKWYNVILINEKNTFLTAIFEETLPRRESLSEGAKKYLLFYKNISLAYQALDNNGNILDVNPSWLKLLGYKEADVLGTRFRDYLHPDHVLIFERNFETFKQKGSSQDLVVKLRKQNGGYIFAALEGVIEYDSHKKPIRAHSVFKDITIQKTLEQELTSQSERLNMAIEASQTGIWDWNFKEKRIYLDNRSYKMADYVESDFQNFLSEFRKRIYPKDLTKVQNEIIKHLKGRSKTFDVEYRILKKNNEWMWIRTHGKITSRDSNGNPVRLSGTNTDIDFRKISELKIRESEQNFKTMFNRIGDALFIMDFEGNIIQSNPAASEQTGYSSEELQKLNLLKTISIFKTEKHSKDVIQRLKNNESISFEEKKIKKNGEEYWTECALNLINLKGKNLVLSVNREITEKKKTEDRIRRLSYVVEQNPASIVITDLNGTIEYINPKFTDLTGYFPEEAIGENPKVLKSGKMDQNIYKELWDTITNGETWKGELLNRKKNGELFWELASISPLKNEADEITHYVGIKEDITKRKKHEKTENILLEISQICNIQNTLYSFLKDVHQKIKEIIRADNFYVALYNSDDNTFSFPYHVDEFDQLELDKPYDFSNGYTDFVFKSNQSLIVTPDYQLEVEKDGIINGYGDDFSVWLGVPLKPDKKSKPIGVIAIQDYKNLEPYSEIDQALMEIISYHIIGFIERIKYLQELVRAKEKAEESEAQMNESQRVARIGYYSFNIKEGTWKSSEMLEEIFGIDDNYNRDVNGWLNLIHPDFKEIMQDYLHKEVITGRNRFDKQYKIINQKTQSEQWVHGLGNLGFNNQGEAITMFGTIQDISNIKQYEDELIHAKEKAEESDKLKSAFLANMSHEIRTPMNGILGFLDLLQNLNLSKKERDTYFDIVNKSGKRLMDTVNDIIEMSIIESGQIQITPKQVQVANLLSDFSDFFSLQAKEKGVKLILKIPKKSQKLVITTDESKLGIIISNLLRNAIKFTNKGQIEFGIKEEDDIVFYVKDTGRGIPQESLESVFDRFVQADTSLTRNYEGSGLGLSICQGYVKLLGGKIWVESTINKGSSFYFSLPYSFAFNSNDSAQNSS